MYADLHAPQRRGALAHRAQSETQGRFAPKPPERHRLTDSVSPLSSSGADPIATPIDAEAIVREQLRFWRAVGMSDVDICKGIGLRPTKRVRPGDMVGILLRAYLPLSGG